MDSGTNKQAVIPYLILNDAAVFKSFVEVVFDATILMVHLHEDQTTIRHAEADIRGSKIMFASSIAEWEPQPANLFIYVEDADKTFRKALDNGGTTIQELGNQEYGRSGGVKDPTGNVWWIAAENQ